MNRLFLLMCEQKQPIDVESDEGGISSEGSRKSDCASDVLDSEKWKQSSKEEKMNMIFPTMKGSAHDYGYLSAPKYFNVGEWRLH